MVAGVKQRDGKPTNARVSVRPVAMEGGPERRRRPVLHLVALEGGVLLDPDLEQATEGRRVVGEEDAHGVARSRPRHAVSPPPLPPCSPPIRPLRGTCPQSFRPPSDRQGSRNPSAPAPTAARISRR